LWADDARFDEGGFRSCSGAAASRNPDAGGDDAACWAAAVMMCLKSGNKGEFLMTYSLFIVKLKYNFLHLKLDFNKVF